MKYITGAATLTLPSVYGLRLEINQATTGTVTIADADGTKAIIAIGMTTAKVYYGFNGPVTITNSAAENITVSILNHQS